MSNLCGDDSSSRDILRAISRLMIVLCFIEFVIGCTSFFWFTDAHFGSWWATILPFISAVFGLSKSNETIVYSAGGICVMGIMVAWVGVFIDGYQSDVVGGEQGCVNTNTGQTWGTIEGRMNAIHCSSDFSGNFTDSVYYTYDNNVVDDLWFKTQCVCSNNKHCVGYELTTGEDCGFILSHYRNILRASVAFLVALNILSMIFSYIILFSGKRDDNNAPNPIAPISSRYNQVPLQSAIVSIVSTDIEPQVAYASEEPFQEEEFVHIHDAEVVDENTNTIEVHPQEDSV